ncbi:hypothetical protein ES707_03299 [subsurface metagenome]|jgi:hypothetical protein
MISLFLRARTSDYFKARSVARDLKTDQSRVEAVAAAIGDALSSCEAEYSGLSRRMEDVGARATIAVGNDVDEYLSREPADRQNLALLETEMINGNLRLKELALAIGHFKFLKTVLLSRFPDAKLPVTRSERGASKQGT